MQDANHLTSICASDVKTKMHCQGSSAQRYDVNFWNKDLVREQQEYVVGDLQGWSGFNRLVGDQQAWSGIDHTSR
jgi:hypothetical protein